MNANPLLIVGPPWIMLADLDSDQFALRVDELRASGGQVIEIDGANATSSAALFDEFAQVASFPSYFGRNWAALDECLADLEWLPGTSYVVTIKNPHRILELCPQERPLLVRVITKVAIEWAEPVIAGEDWDRPSIPFHLVAHWGDSGSSDGEPLASTRSGILEWLGDNLAKI
jgi:RNAse (barnase) inhibitor barstar